jgi:hypothetical protein
LLAPSDLLLKVLQDPAEIAGQVRQEEPARAQLLQLAALLAFGAEKMEAEERKPQAASLG